MSTSTTYTTSSSRQHKRSVKPIASYGLILCAKNTGRFLIAQRRDTIEYTEFIRGRVSKYLYPVYFSRMTAIERWRLVSYTFNQLWDDLWVNHNNKFYREAYPNARSKFALVKPNLEMLLRNFPIQQPHTTTTNSGPSWGFPKGKLNYASEKPEHAAIREFIEETRIQLDYKNLIDAPSLTETFTGTNGKVYSTTYFIALVDEETPIQYTTPNCMRPNTVSEEIADMRWVSIETAREQYLIERRVELLERSRRFIEEYTSRKHNACC